MPVLLFIAFPALEFYLLFLLSSRIGALPVFGLVFLSFIAGIALISFHGRSFLPRISAVFSGSLAPETALRQSMFACLAGMLLIFPGLVSDLIALLLLTPHINTICAKAFFRLLGARSEARFITIDAPGRRAYSGRAPDESGPADGDGVVFDCEARECAARENEDKPGQS